MAKAARPVAFRGKWRIRWFDHEGARQSAVLESYADAERELRRHQVEADDVRAGLRRPSPVEHTFAELADYWEEHRATEKRTEKDEAHQRLLETGARAAEIIEQEPRLLSGHVEGQPTPEPQVPNDGWSDRYREGAKLHAEPDVREMWARILAGEVTKPGSFAFKTLSVLKDVDTESAQKFASLLGFAVNKQGLPAANEFQQHYAPLGVTYLDLLRLAELGLIAFPAVSAITETSPPLMLEGRGGYVFALHERQQPVNVHTLTRAGQELALVTDSKTTQAAVVALAEWLTPKCARLQVGFRIDPDHVFARA